MKKFLTVLFSAACLLGWSRSTAQEFPVRGFHIDFRAEVMSLDAMKEFATELAGFGINTIVMEWEATFPFDRHATICNRHAFKPEDITEFVSHCTGLGIDVIPLQHCFGHVEYILRHDRYNRLKEDHNSELSQICPLKPGSAELFSELFTEVAALHPSQYFHIGGDETFLLGMCPKCSKFVAEHGKSKLFVDYIKKMCNIVTGLGKRPVLWADIIIKYPEAIDQLPKDAILVDWNYGWDIKHFGDIDKVYSSGLEIWGAPAIRCSPDNFYLTSWPTHFNNQRDFIPYGREAGYKGMIMTSWSTSGLYGFFWEPRHEVTAMDPVRTVYPMDAFRILIAMYGEALRSPSPVDPEAFAVKYARDRFGLKEKQARELWNILYTPQTVVRWGKDGNGRGKPVEEARDEVQTQRDALGAMKVKRNTREFEQFKLMWDIRLQYLEYKIVENRFNSADFDRSQAPELLKQLEERVISRTADLDRRFAEMYGTYFKEAEIPYLNSVRVRKIDQTAAALRAIQ